jgi:hypothetical protein
MEGASDRWLCAGGAVPFESQALCSRYETLGPLPTAEIDHGPVDGRLGRRRVARDMSYAVGFRQCLDRRLGVFAGGGGTGWPAGE